MKEEEMKFKVGDIVEVLEGANCNDDQIGRAYAVAEIISENLVEVYVDQPGHDCGIFYTTELKSVSLEEEVNAAFDNIADWESDYYDSALTEDYLSESTLSPHNPKTCDECVIIVERMAKNKVYVPGYHSAIKTDVELAYPA